jgi:hypothetical protein
MKMITSDEPEGKFGNCRSVLQLDFSSIMIARAPSYMKDSEASN